MKRGELAKAFLAGNRYARDHSKYDSFDDWYDKYITSQKKKKCYILPNDKKIKKAADEYEYKAACGYPASDYINEDFIAGVNWLKSQLKKGYPKKFCKFCIDQIGINDREENHHIYLYQNYKKELLYFDTIDKIYKYWLTTIKDK